MHDGRARHRQGLCPGDEALIPIMAPQRHVGHPGQRPFDAPVGDDDGCGAGQDLLALLIGATRVEKDDPLLRPLFQNRHGRGDGIVGRYRPDEPELLFQIDRARTGEPCAEQGGDERACSHAMSDDMPERARGGEGGVEMGRVRVARYCGKQVDVVTDHGTDQRSRVSRLQLVERPVLQKVGQDGITFERRKRRARRRAADIPLPARPIRAVGRVPAVNAPQASPTIRPTMNPASRLRSPPTGRARDSSRQSF